MRVLFVFLIMWAPLFCAESPFPHLALYNLRGEKRAFPNGKRGLVFMGWRQEACETLAQWYQALHDKPRIARRLAITVVPIFPPCMSYAVCRAPLMVLLQKCLPERLSRHVGVLFSSVEETASLFRLPQEDFSDLRVFLVDERGEILWQTAGVPTAQSLRQLERAADVQEGH
jgi:hypothetical protein